MVHLDFVRKEDLMNQGLRPVQLLRVLDALDGEEIRPNEEGIATTLYCWQQLTFPSVRKEDLMNKGLRHNRLSRSCWVRKNVRNLDLMKKGLVG